MESILLRHLCGTAAPEYASFSISQQITWPIEARAGWRWEAALHDLAMGALEKVEHHISGVARQSNTSFERQ